MFTSVKRGPRAVANFLSVKAKPIMTQLVPGAFTGKLVQSQPISALTLRHSGHWGSWKGVWNSLTKFAFTHGTSSKETRAVAIFYDDPCLLGLDNCRFDACLSVTHGQAESLTLLGQLTELDGVRVETVLAGQPLFRLTPDSPDPGRATPFAGLSAIEAGLPGVARYRATWPVYAVYRDSPTFDATGRPEVVDWYAATEPVGARRDIVRLAPAAAPPAFCDCSAPHSTDGFEGGIR